MENQSPWPKPEGETARPYTGWQQPASWQQQQPYQNMGGPNQQYAPLTSGAPMAPTYPQKKKTIMGLRKPIFLIVVVVGVVILLAIVGGVAGALAIKAKKNSQNNSNNKSSTPSGSNNNSNIDKNNFVAPTDVAISTTCKKGDKRTLKLSDKSDAVFNLECDANSDGDDLTRVISYSLDDCMIACAKYNAIAKKRVCAGVSFSPDLKGLRTSQDGNCALKTKKGTTKTAKGVISAYF
ncbi:hypothetical protein VHEMI01135 [[Torrubiella] hemipterigena]|uniref:Apple domain-containing protein n=1 Tax=[Torrubiella] hemipterigena TaxID=1531966 RepID=A0A0A1T4D5_9HYPO|nr:hypothetical protein VHEMI01135 [[Torrubiella] hemipterigena]